MSAANEFQPLMDDLFREKVLRARRQTPEEKFLLGLQLFESSVNGMRRQIRHEFPLFTAEQIEEEIHRRYRRIRQVEDHGIFAAKTSR